MRKINVLGVKFSDINDQELDEILRSNISTSNNFKIITPNPEIVMRAQKDQKLIELINSAGLVLKDGVGIVIAQKIAGIEGEGRQTGFDTLKKILSIADERALDIYIVGAKQETLDQAIENIKKDYKNLNIVGSHNGYRKEKTALSCFCNGFSQARIFYIKIRWINFNVNRRWRKPRCN